MTGVPRDIVIDKTSMTTSSASGNLPRPSPMGFRRCSLEHARHVEEAKRHPAAARPARRRSSLKASSSYGAAAAHNKSSAAAAEKKHVVFSESARMKIIDYRDEAYLQETWLSQEERIGIQHRARADIKTIKHLMKNPHLLEDNPELRALRSSMSLRGLEQFYSKRIHRNLVQEQLHVICDVLEAQEYLNESSRSFGTQHLDRETKIAQISDESSLAARKRALRQGQEDEAAVRKYLGREANKSPPSPAPSRSASPSPSSASPLSQQQQPSANRTSRSLEVDNRPPRPRVLRRASMPTVSSYSTHMSALDEIKDDYH